MGFDMIPKVIQSGVTVKITASAGATLTANNGSNIITIAESEGNITFAHDANYNAGQYRYTITDDNNEMVDAGIFQMLPGLSSGDGRTESQKILEAINARIAGTATQGQSNIQVDGKSIRWMGIAELERAKRIYEDIVDDEIAIITGRASTNTYYATFTRP